MGDERLVWTILVKGLTLRELCTKIDGVDFGDGEHVRVAHVGDMFEERDGLEDRVRELEDQVVD